MKERLTGAIILVALIVLLVPELLTGPIRTQTAPAASSIASPPIARAGARVEPPLRTYTLTLGAPAGADDPLATPAAQPARGLAQSAPQSSTDTAAASPEASGSPRQAPALETATPHTDAPGVPKRSAAAASALQAAKSPAHRVVKEDRASAASAGWLVQLGSFASHENATRLARTLAARGFRTSVSPARARSRVLWRVRAGPVHDRAAAQHLAARLRALGHRGEVLPVR